MIAVLYVDADAQMRSIISHICERTSAFSVYTTGSCNKALEWLKENNTDVIISSCHLEEMNGIELLQELRQRGILTPFIFFTEEDNPRVKTSAYDLDAFGFIIRKGNEKKPILNLMRMIYWTVGRNDLDDLLEKPT